MKKYCKRGYFHWGKISRKCWPGISRGGNFHDTTPISFITAYGFYFRVGVIFAKKTKARKTRKLPPRENFHVYSSPLEKGPHRPIMALPWIHHCADLAQKSIQMCGSHEYSQMLVDNCYAFSLLLQHSTLKEKFFGEGAPH